MSHDVYAHASSGHHPDLTELTGAPELAVRPRSRPCLPLLDYSVGRAVIDCAAGPIKDPLPKAEKWLSADEELRL